jgi:hypothetical protein
MSSPTNDYRLVVFDRPNDTAPLRDLLVGVLGLHPTEANQWIARTPGIWSRPLAEGEARELLDGMFKLEIPAEAWRVDLLPKLAPARSVHIVACLADGLRIGGLHGEPAHWVPWPKISVIHGGRIATEDQIRAAEGIGWANALGEGLNAMILRRPSLPRVHRAPRTPRDPIAEVHIVREDPRIAFRFISDKLNYAYLSDRLQTSAMENFPLFLGDLVQSSTHAYVTDSARELLEECRGNETADPPTYASSLAMLDDTTLRLIWSWYRRDRDRQTRVDD